MMQSDKRGGRSSATRSEGAPTPRGAAGSQNSPPPFALPETAQEKAGAFSKRRSRISVDNYFSHFVHAAPKTAAGKQRSSPANHRAVASSELLACRSLCHYAQLHPFVLRAEYCSRPTPQELNRVLEKSRYASMAASCPDPDLATRVLGSAVTPVRILWREVALRGKQSGAPRQGELNVLEWHDP